MDMSHPPAPAPREAGPSPAGGPGSPGSPIGGSEFLQRRLKLRHLRLILVLHDAGSVSQAAERLCISQAAVSKTRAEIEDLLGMPLFKRNARWEPTAIGAELIASARRIMAELDCLNGEFLMLRDGISGTVVVGMRTVAMVPVMARTCAAFKALYPNVTVTLLDAALPDLLRQMQKGAVDLVIAPRGSGRDLDGLTSVMLRRERHVVMASPRHPFVERSELGWAEAVAAAWCLPPEGTRVRVHLTDFLRQHGFAFPTNVVEANSFLMMIALMQEMPLLNLAPIGIARLLHAQRLVEILRLPVDGAHDLVNMAWPSDVALEPAARLFRDFVLRRIEDAAEG